MRRFFAILAVTAAVACGGDGDSTPRTTLTGGWSGAVSNGTLALTLTQAGTQVTGNGSIVGPSGSAALTVAGTAQEGVAAPTFSLTLSSGGFQPINYAGTVQRNGTSLTMTGTMNGSGFVNVSANLTKTP